MAYKQSVKISTDVNHVIQDAPHIFCCYILIEPQHLCKSECGKKLFSKSTTTELYIIALWWSISVTYYL